VCGDFKSLKTFKFESFNIFSLPSMQEGSHLSYWLV